MPYNIDLPDINALNDRDRISRILQYLYRQAEQLGWALNDLDGKKPDASEIPSPPEPMDAFVAIKGLIMDSDDIFEAYADKLGDYVIEAGTANGWTYKKWNSGTYEMWARFLVTPTSSTKGESLYITNAIEIPTPFEISGDALITGMGKGDYWLTGGAYVAADKISIKIISDTALSTTEQAGVRLHVVGTYVTNTEE